MSGFDRRQATEGRSTGGSAVLPETERLGRHRQAASVRFRRTPRRRRVRLAAVIAAAVALIVLVVVMMVPGLRGQGNDGLIGPGQGRGALPATSGSYLGLYPGGIHGAAAGVSAFTSATKVKPNVVLYYSGWYEPFESSFTRSVSSDGAVPLVQLNPEGVSLAGIASGRYDSYLRTYAASVRGYGRSVIMSFGHEMNGYWYSWGYKKTSPATFVAAWRHIVTLFRQQKADNVTWMWTVNVVDDPYYGDVPNPAKWWPGRSYVNWVGIDGYYYRSSTTFSSLFGPTIADVREITRDPILIAETAATPAAGQAAKIDDIFAGVNLYGLLGFVWFDVSHPENWQLNGPSSTSAYRRGAQTFRRPGS
jgi:mannan endo-1,4-beta-mannosidase